MSPVVGCNELGKPGLHLGSVSKTQVYVFKETLQGIDGNDSINTMVDGQSIVTSSVFQGNLTSDWARHR